MADLPLVRDVEQCLLDGLSHLFWYVATTRHTDTHVSHI
jgi:hypothetical protein